MDKKLETKSNVMTSSRIIYPYACKKNTCNYRTFSNYNLFHKLTYFILRKNISIYLFIYLFIYQEIRGVTFTNPKLRIS